MSRRNGDALPAEDMEPVSGADCLDDLAGYMHDNDLRPGLPSNQNVTTYTIGFGDDVAGTTFLDEVAQAGGGENFFAGDSESLTTVLTNIVSKISNTSTTFVAPAVAVNAFNRTESLADLYLSVFEPTSTMRSAWSRSS